MNFSDLELLQARRFRVVRRSVDWPDGRSSQHDVVLHPGAVAILPLLDHDRICLVRNQRPAVGQTLWELPAGTLEPGEDPQKTASRELAEETGYQAHQMVPLTRFWMSPGILRESMHLFLASGLTRGPTSLEADERIQTEELAWPEVWQMVADGRICDAKTLVGLFWYDRWKARQTP